jgi:hypothetical protein
MAYPHHAFMGFDNPMGQREAQPGALILCRVEGMENFLSFGSGDAWTGIIDRYKSIPRFLKINTGVKEKVPSAWHGLDGIVNDVLKNLA